MDLEVDESFADLKGIDSFKAWSKCLEQHVTRLGFSRFMFSLRASVKADPRSGLNTGNFPASWWEVYERAAYARIDPVVLHCTHSVLPVVWAERLYNSTIQRALREDAVAHGLAHGVTLALHGPKGMFGTFDLSLDDASEQQVRALIQAHWSELSLLRDSALQSALKFLDGARAAGAIKLTKREKEVLQWSALGKTSWEISNICSCSEASVDFHFRNIRRKFGGTTRIAAAVRALSMQIIQI